MSWLSVVLLLNTCAHFVPVAIAESSLDINVDTANDSLRDKKTVLVRVVTLSKLMEKIDEQEARLKHLQQIVEEQREDSKRKAIRIEQLEIIVTGNVDDLKRKDIRIDHLQNKMADLVTQIKVNKAIPHNVNDNAEEEPIKVLPDDDKIRSDSEENGIPNNVLTKESRTQNSLSKVRHTRHEITERVGDSSTGVAFCVSLRTTANMFPHEVVMYDNVLLDTMKGYNHANGIYVVPETGVYVFTWSVTSGTTNEYGAVITEILINGSVQDLSFADSSLTASGSATGLVVTSVNKGDHVYIRSIYTGRMLSENNAKSTFSGWRLF